MGRKRSGNPNPLNQFEKGHSFSLRHGARAYRGAKEAGRPIRPGAAAVELEVRTTLAEEGELEFFERNAIIAQTIVGLLWKYIGENPDEFLCILPKLGWMLGVSNRAWMAYGLEKKRLRREGQSVIDLAALAKDISGGTD